MRIEDLNWMDVEEYLKRDDRLMIILGACEQHGYLSLLTDSKIPMALADAASQKSGVLVAPPVNFGCSPYFMAYPGTFSVNLDTLRMLVEDIIHSAYQHGFRKILILNGHGGNQAIKTHLFELANRYEDLMAQWYEWWKSPSVEAIARKYDLKPAHANWLEAFRFTIVGELPNENKVNIEANPIINSQRYRQIIGDGSFGGVYQTEGRIMDEIFQACVEEVVELLKF